jgi:glycosyltransferase involved in cell wall biosynthesis
VFLQFIQQATVCVIPSRWENCPYTILEAMACGRATVATNAYGMAELVEDGRTGMLFGPDDSADLAERVIELLRDGQLRVRLGQAARRVVVERHSISTVAVQMERFFNEVIDQARLQ